MSERPIRVQLSRKKGWKMPPNTVKVTRPGIYGNPFIVSPKVKPGGRSGASYFCMPTVDDAVAAHREMWAVIQHEQPDRFAAMQSELRGNNLACWCKIGEPCHADVLLELANQKEQP